VAHSNKSTSRFPTREEILEFLDTAEGKISKREIARAFHIKGPDRVQLKALLKDMADQGEIAKDYGKSLRRAGKIPSVLLVKVTGIDELGDLICVPVNWPLRERDDRPPSDEELEAAGPVPRIFMVSGTQRGQTLRIGDRALVRLTEMQDQDGPYFSARLIRLLESGPQSILGIYKGAKSGGRIIPSDRKARKEYNVTEENRGGASDGALVVAELLPRRGRKTYGLQEARIIETLGDLNEPKSISLISIHHHDIPMEFSAEAIHEAKAAKPVPLGNRKDLRHIPLITIDPIDARDHDDAIFAAQDDEPGNKDGWKILVAIADVAHYVRPGSAINKDAATRGNSCYFPDRVVPMLPEELSADLCSLKPGVDRPAMVADMRIDKKGNLLGHKFYRALINSHANINYGEVQAAQNGAPTELTAPLMDTVIGPLYSAFAALAGARKARHPLELDLPERKVELDEDGNVKSVFKRERLDAHKLVEEFMILANVAAAEALEKKNILCMYRVHEEPSFDKLESLREFLKTVEINLAKGQVIRPILFNRILEKVADTPVAEMVNEVVLRSQSQAYYSPDNKGHFGLALARYAHFTSPIRRYSDLLVHRGLIRAFGLGADGLSIDDINEMRQIGETISGTERRAMAAERESTDRYLAAFLKNRVGDVMEARISGVIRFGLFVTIEPSGADGIIPVSTLHSDYFQHDETRHELKGRSTGKCYRLGDVVQVRLVEAEQITGSLKFEMVEEQGQARPKSRRKSRGAYKKAKAEKKLKGAKKKKGNAKPRKHKG